MNDIVTFKDEQLELEVNISPEEDTVWLTQAQMVDLFSRDQSVIARHIRNIFKEHELEEKSNMHFLHIANSDKPVKMYSLDVIISVGYRVKIASWRSFSQMGNQCIKAIFPYKNRKNRHFKRFSRLLIWSGRRDSNSRPLVPETSALPNCATPRHFCVAR